MRQQAGASVIHRLSTARITRFQEALQKRVVEIQRQTTGLIYEVSGGLNRLVGADVMTVVAWDGYPQHSTLLSIPLVGVYLDLRHC